MKNAKFASTTNYNLFEMNDLNRGIDQRDDIAKDMIKNGFKPSCAIHVEELPSGKLKIIGGHHRFNEAKRLGIEVYYIVDNDNTDVAENEKNQGKNWTAKDWIQCYVSKGRRDYIILDEYVKRTNVPLMCAVSMVHGESASSANASRMLAGGRFRVGNMKHADEVADVCDVARNSKLCFAVKTGFVRAVSRAIRFAGADYIQLRDKIKRFGCDIKDRGKADDFLEELEYVYNKASRGDTLPIKYLAIKNGKAAQQTFSAPKNNV